MLSPRVPTVSAKTSPEIQALFNRIAPVYDQLNDWLSLGQHRLWKHMTVKWSGAEPGDTCLDVCCGSGDLALLLARQVSPSGRVVGLDFAPAQLAIARRKAYRRCLDPITDWMQGDALNLPFSANTFDAITLGYGLRNVSAPLRSLQELHRVLKAGAKAAILDLHRPSTLSMQALQQWYLRAIVVPAAQQWGLTAEYAYISPSLQCFPTGPEQVELAYRAGFTAAVHYPLAGGMMGVLVATKAGNPSSNLPKA